MSFLVYLLKIKAPTITEKKVGGFLSLISFKELIKSSKINVTIGKLMFLAGLIL
jgi:hypothetical protein